MSTFVGIPRIPAAAPEREMPEADRRAVRMAVSLLLDYPGEDFLEKVGAVEAELAAAGLRMTRWWTDPDGDFGVSLAVPA